MKVQPASLAVRAREELNFVLTNRIPRLAATRLLGWFSRIEHPLVVRPAIALWRAFGGLDLQDCPRRRFRSIHDCFTRELRPGARAPDPTPGVLLSPCDGIVVACGVLRGLEMLQAKGLDYSLGQLLGDTALAERFREGTWVSLRLSAGMYHRFHAPADAVLSRVRHIAGDTWNVNPPALARVPQLYCRNERMVIELTLRQPAGATLLLVPVAAVGVAGIRLRGIEGRFGLGYEGPTLLDCAFSRRRGEELGHFEQGSTIVVIAPPGFTPLVAIGDRLRAGERLLGLPA
jgi:phosphatidylserine decarboxylase